MIPYLFLGGFLGSGKTTLLNGLLDTYKGKRIGVIVNDFGEMGIDTALIDDSGLAGEIQELKAGQIFCSCLSGSFVESVVAYQEVNPDLLIVECSGLAKPSSMKDITRAIDLTAPGQFECAGMVCLVDGVSHLDLEDTLMVLTEQMEASDLLLITKTDLLDVQGKEEIFGHLARKYPDKKILFSTHGRFDGDLLSLLDSGNGAYRDVDTGRFDGWGKKGRPTTFVISPGMKTARALRQSLTPYLGRLYRIKGMVETSDQGPIFFDGTSAGIKAYPPPRQMEAGLVIITHDPNLRFELGFL